MLVGNIQSRFWPLSRFQESHRLDELFVQLVPSQSMSYYITLSHVRANGLGNPHKNALARCQVAFLHQITDNFHAAVNPHVAEGILLWCDTVCCPTEPGKAKHIALAEMKKASQVLVLDASL